MQRGKAFPSQEFVWTVLAPRIEAYLTEQKLTILELIGLYRLFGPPGEGFTGELEGDETIKELTGQIVVSFCEDLIERIDSVAFERKAGRPCDVLTRALGPRLLDMFLRYNSSAGRRSAWTSVDGKLVQEETGPLFEFIKAAIKPINDYLVGEQSWKPICPARLARYALAERRRIALAVQTRAAKRRQMAEQNAHL
ncbi:hypothetical protein ACFIOY_34965 [Bradyrhizobium sp. TZ2]